MQEPFPNPFVRLARAFGYSVEGLKAALATEWAFRAELLAAMVLVPYACIADVSAERKLAMIMSVMLVMVVELLNTGIETAINRISAERHPLSKKAKDIGSAAVLLTLLNAALMWGIALLCR